MPLRALLRDCLFSMNIPALRALPPARASFRARAVCPRFYFCCRSGESVPHASTDTSLVARDMAV